MVEGSWVMASAIEDCGWMVKGLTYGAIGTETGEEERAEDKPRQNFIYAGAELPRLTLDIPTRRATIAGRGIMPISNP